MRYILRTESIQYSLKAKIVLVDALRSGSEFERKGKGYDVMIEGVLPRCSSHCLTVEKHGWKTQQIRTKTDKVFLSLRNQYYTVTP